MKKYIFRLLAIIFIVGIGLSCRKEDFTTVSDNLRTSEVKRMIRQEMGKQNLEEKEKEVEVLFDANNLKEKTEDIDNNSQQTVEDIDNNNIHAPDTDNSDVKEIIESIEREHKSESNFNLDLTEMHPDMIFATVFMIVQDPESVRGKTIRVKGNLYTFPTPDGKSTTQYCIIKDALQCCAQGLHLIPKEAFDTVPADDTPILVEGVLEPYTIEGVPMQLCRIKDAKVEVIE